MNINKLSYRVFISSLVSLSASCMQNKQPAATLASITSLHTSAARKFVQFWTPTTPIMANKPLNQALLEHKKTYYKFMLSRLAITGITTGLLFRKIYSKIRSAHLGTRRKMFEKTVFSLLGCFLGSLPTWLYAPRTRLVENLHKLGRLRKLFAQPLNPILSQSDIEQAKKDQWEITKNSHLRNLNPQERDGYLEILSHSDREMLRGPTTDIPGILARKSEITSTLPESYKAATMAEAQHARLIKGLRSIDISLE
jgi:hypothetical protein